MTDEKKLEAIHNLLGKHNIVFSVNFIDELKSIIEQFEPILYKCKHLGCEIMRTKEEGGTTFTVCDYHWENRNAPPGNPPQIEPLEVEIFSRENIDDRPNRWLVKYKYAVLDYFLTENQAIDFCTKHGLKVINKETIK